VTAKSGDFGGSLLLAYKLNWQSVVFVGYGDDRELTDQARLARLDRQGFVKMSYALQRRGPVFFGSAPAGAVTGACCDRRFGDRREL
jgi:hypothetical protein